MICLFLFDLDLMVSLLLSVIFNFILIPFHFNQLGRDNHLYFDTLHKIYQYLIEDSQHLIKGFLIRPISHILLKDQNLFF